MPTKKKRAKGGAAPPAPPFQAVADKIAATLDTDVLFYNGPVERHFDQRVIELCSARRRRTNVALILVTDGGDADAAYRIAHVLQQKYQHFTLYVPGYCKSAGTLIAIGAHQLVISDQGELGPLDVQFVRKDELFEQQSGLTAGSALETLNGQAFQAFESFFLQIKTKGQSSITLRTATDLAVKLTCGLFSHVYQQIDPMHVGEAGRALEIAREYGQRLAARSQNFKGQVQSCLEHLVSHYPSHSFIIDLAEAKSIFKNVRDFNNLESELLGTLGVFARWPVRRPEDYQVQFISSEKGATPRIAEGRKHGGQTKSRSESDAGTGTGGAAEAPGPSGTAVAQITAIKRRNA